MLTKTPFSRRPSDTLKPKSRLSRSFLTVTCKPVTAVGTLAVKFRDTNVCSFLPPISVPLPFFSPTDSPSPPHEQRILLPNTTCSVRLYTNSHTDRGLENVRFYTQCTFHSCSTCSRWILFHLPACSGVLNNPQFYSHVTLSHLFLLRQKPQQERAFRRNL